MRPTLLFNFRPGDSPEPSPTRPPLVATWLVALAVLCLPTLAFAQSLDFGDAPPPYPTRLQLNGARHAVSPIELRFGQNLDFETDGQPNLSATGDDIVPVGAGDDEDGIQMLTAPLLAGAQAQVRVTVSTSGRLDAWIDFNANGSWADPGDKIFTNTLVLSGANVLTFNIPAGTKDTTNAYARFRLSAQGGLNFDGLATEGEVEDYRFEITGESLPTDFSDAPRVYQTVLSENGARHIITQNLRMGLLIDGEADGQPNSTATGDDINPPTADDEDGVTFLGPLNAGASTPIHVVVNATARLDAWVDFNADGDWADASEQVFASVILAPGTNALSFFVPVNTTDTTNAYARFRVSFQGGLPSFGPAPNGEVEDYLLAITSVPMDFSDAPDPTYPTTLQSNGARHRIVTDVKLGALIDSEPNGQPSAAANGDDINPSPSTDDEDGIVFTTPIVVGQNASVQVTASIQGRLDAWLDFNANGSWADAGDQIFTSILVPAGTSLQNFMVPTPALVGPTYARFRFSRQGGLSFNGPATDGEVEDYSVRIDGSDQPCDRTNKGVDFWLTFPGNLAPDPDNPVKPSLCIVGVRTTTGTVSIPGLGFSTNFVIPASMEVVIPLPKEADLGNAIDLIQARGIHVTADREVAVFGLNRVRWTSDGFLGLPTDVLGTDYLIQGFANVHTGVPALSGSQFALVACDDNTTVNITPPINVAGHPANAVFSITLNKGDAYQLRSINNAPADLSGTIIKADKPIAAFGSHQCAQIPDNTVWFCDYIVEQLLSEPRAGTNFIALPIVTRSSSTYRIQAIQNGTTVRTNGILAAILSRGQSHQMTVGGPVHVATDRPALVTQYANSSDYDLVVNSDPFSVNIPAPKLFLNNYMVCTPDASFVSNYISVVIPNAGVGSINLDGAAIPAGAYSPIPGSGYSGATVAVGPGVHNLLSTGNALRFGVILYGFAEYDSYGYPGGMFFTDATPPMITCLTSNVTIGTTPNAPCMGIVPDLTKEVEVKDNCPLPATINVFQEPASGTLLPVGMHTVTITVFDAAGNSASCTTKLTIHDNGTIAMTCPSPIITNCVSRLGTIVTFKPLATTPCGSTNLIVTCQPSSGSVFPPGVTQVICSANGNPGQTATCGFNVTVRCLTIDRGPNSTVRLTWTGGGTLETSPSVPASQWTPVTGQTSPATLGTPDNTRFFRIRY